MGRDAVRPVLEALHGRLLGGDQTAADELCRMLYPELRRHVPSPTFHGDPHEIDSAIDDALAGYIGKPWRFDPGRGSLAGWLIVVARNRLRDRWRRRRRLLAREVALTGRLPSIAPDVEARADDRDASTLRLRRLHQLFALCRDERERAFLRARILGKSVSAQAAAVGKADLSLIEQRKVVNRLIEGLRKRYRRAERLRRPGR